MTTRTAQPRPGSCQWNIVYNLPGVLSGREQACLILYGQGLSGKEIAIQLDISYRTVCFHLENCCHAFEVDSTRMAVIKAVKAGEIPCPTCGGKP